MTLPWRAWVTRHIWLRALGGLAAGTATILMGAGLMATSGYLISRAALRPPIAELMLVFVAVRFFGLARPALRYVERLASHDATFRLLTAIRSSFVRTLLPLSRGQLRGFRSGDLLSRLCSDVDILQEAWLRVGAPALVAIVASCITVGALATVQPMLAVTVGGLLVFNGLLWSWVASRLDRGLGESRNAERRALAADLVTLLQGLPDVLAFGYEEHALAEIRTRQHHLDAVDHRYAWRLALHAGVGTVVTYAGFMAALASTIHAAGRGELSIVWIAAIALAVVAAFEAVDNLPAAWQHAAQTRDSARRVAEIAALEPAIRESRNPARVRRDEVPPAIRLDHVTFGYGRRIILNHVSLAVAPGEHIGIRGVTGSGKSTLLDLVMRAWDPLEGTIRVGGIDLRDMAFSDLRTTIVSMPQQVHVFNSTLRDNVRLARASASDTEVHTALAAAQLMDFVNSLPEGLNTVLGERGARMSAGEQRRLGFARILLSNARVVLLDEPTEHLDVTTERGLLWELKRWAQGRTMMVVSHRDAPLALADRTVTIHEGQLIQPY
jgi:thiol reductant ABC exporter CydC subunit